MKKNILYFIIFLFYPTYLVAGVCPPSNLTPLTSEVKKAISDIKSLSEKINNINSETMAILVQDDPGHTQLDRKKANAKTLGPDFFYIRKQSNNNIDLKISLFEFRITWLDSECQIVNKAVSINKNKEFKLCETQNLYKSEIDLFYRDGQCKADFINDGMRKKFFNYVNFLEVFLKSSIEIHKVVTAYESNNPDSGKLFENTYPEVMLIIDKIAIEQTKI